MEHLTVLVGCGPYTTEDSLDFGALQALLDKAEQLKADSLVLSGPFLDIEHALVRAATPSTSLLWSVLVMLT